MKKVTLGQAVITAIAAGAAFIFGGKFLNKSLEEDPKDNASLSDSEANAENAADKVNKENEEE